MKHLKFNLNLIKSLNFKLYRFFFALFLYFVHTLSLFLPALPFTRTPHGPDLACFAALLLRGFADESAGSVRQQERRKGRPLTGEQQWKED